MPIKRYAAGRGGGNDSLPPSDQGDEEQGHVLVHEPPTELSEAVGETECVLAWSTDSLDELSNLDDDQEMLNLSIDDDRRPLSVALMTLLASVVICGIGLGAYVIGEHVNRVYVRPARAAAQTPAAGIGELLTNPPTTAVATPTPMPTTPVAMPTTPKPLPPPALTFPPRAWDAFTSLLNARGLSIDPAERDYDDKANRKLCWTLFGSDDPDFRRRFILASIEQSEGGTWGKPEATYAIHSAVMAYCPQFDKGFPAA